MLRHHSRHRLPHHFLHVLRLAAGALLLAWIAVAFAVEVDGLRRDAVATPNPGAVGEWRLATPRARAFGDWVRTMEPAIPDGAVVVFTSGTGSRTQDFFLTLWAAYHLPRQRTLALAHPAAFSAGDYLLAYDTTLDDPRLTVVSENHGGVLYRIAPVGSP